MSTTAPAVTAPPNASTLPERGLRVTQARVVRSEWTKLVSLRSTMWSLLAALTITIGLGAAFSAGTASHWSQMGAAERASFDPTQTSLAGAFLAQLAIGVLGVLLVSGEYSTGAIRSTLTAVPRRLPVLWAKAGVFAAVTFVLALAASLVAFVLGQSLLHSTGASASLGDPGVAQAVFGSALYLTGVGLLGLALGALLRSTAGAIASLFGLLLVLPILANFIPRDWAVHIDKWLPSNAGTAVMAVKHDAMMFAPWTGLGVFATYVAVAVTAAAVLLVRRDA